MKLSTIVIVAAAVAGVVYYVRKSGNNPLAGTPLEGLLASSSAPVVADGGDATVDPAEFEMADSSGTARRAPATSGDCGCGGRCGGDKEAELAIATDARTAAVDELDDGFGPAAYREAVAGRSKIGMEDVPGENVPGSFEQAVIDGGYWKLGEACS